MKRLVIIMTLMALVCSVPFAMAKDMNWDSTRETWNAQQAQQKASADKKAKADQEQVPTTGKAQTPASDAGKTK